MGSFQERNIEVRRTGECHEETVGEYSLNIRTVSIVILSCWLVCGNELTDINGKGGL